MKFAKLKFCIFIFGLFFDFVELELELEPLICLIVPTKLLNVLPFYLKLINENELQTESQETRVEYTLNHRSYSIDFAFFSVVFVKTDC